LNTSPDHIEDLIANYLVGEATPEQIIFVEGWRNKNENNRRYFEHLRLIFEKSASSPAAGQFDTDLAWQKLRAKLAVKRESKTIHLNPGYSPYKIFLRIAAGIVMLLTVGFFTYNFFRNDAVQSLEILSDKKTEADTLPDGSDVFLNRKTKIEYTFNRKSNIHRAKLVGEAYFNINHDDNKTFIVEAEGVFVRDIGTSFNVKAYPGSPTVEVVVEEGEVMFFTEGNPGIYLKANGKGIYNKNTKTFTVAEPEPNVSSYKTKFFSFSDQSLEMVVKTLNDVYEPDIDLDNGLRACRLTVSFNDENIEEIANIIAETLGLTVSKAGNVIRLKGSSCGEARP
jgi:ferric-dicitrate binding protein FerR (iron transport regulator)